MSVSTWDMYDTLIGPEQDDAVQQPEPEQTDYPEAAVDSSRAAERSVSLGSTASTGDRPSDTLSHNQRHGAVSF